jgi:periplasmic protein TonB
MITILHTLGLPITLALFALLVIGIIAVFKLVIAHEQKMALQHPSSSVLVKKYPGVDVSKYTGLIRNISIALALFLMIILFEYPSYDKQELITLTGESAAIEEMHEIPPTEHRTPPPPVIKQPEIVEVADEIEIQQDLKIDFDMEATEESVVEEVAVVVREEKVEEVAEEIFEIVEESAEPTGGFSAFYAYVGKNLKYPRQAIDLGVSGKVYVQFVINKDGSITDVKAIRGIGYGCDEEAIRVLSESPNWKPGKQRGRPVKQRMVIPVMFKLSNT